MATFAVIAKNLKVAAVFDDGHTFGRMESFEVWERECKGAEPFPGKIYLVKCPGLSLAIADDYIGQFLDLDALFPSELVDYTAMVEPWQVPVIFNG